MDKIKFKNVFSKAFVVGITAAALASNVNAATVRESAGKTNEIENGAYIVGITRFTNDMVLTTGRVITATQNDVFFKGTTNYVKPPVYQYRGGNWIAYDDENNSSLVSAEEVARLGLNAQDIYYVNNVEKTLEIAYDSNKAAGCTFATDAIGKTVSYSNGILYVPATTKTITVTKNGEKIEELTKSLINENGEFVYNSNGNRYYGSISQDDIITTSGTTVNGETITFNGLVNWVNGKTANLGVDLNGEKTDTSGYRIGVKITAPTGVNLNNDIKVYINGSKDSILFSKSTTGDKGSFKFTPIVEAGKTYTVKVAWTEDFTQTFTIVVGNNFAAMPAGVASGETVKITVKDEATKEDKEVEVVSGTTGSTTNVTFSKIGDNKMPWTGTANVNVKVDDNYAAPSFSITKADGSLKVKAYYPNTKENDLGDIVEANEPISLTNANVSYDSNTKTIAIKNLKFSDDTVHRKIRLEIDWAGDESYVQPIDVVLDNATEFAYPSVRLENVKTQSDKSGAGVYINWPVTGDKAVVSNNIVWNVGNHITAVVVPSTSANNTEDKYKDLTTFEAEDLKHLQISVDGKILGETNDKDEFVPYTLNDASNIADGSNILKNAQGDSAYGSKKVFALDLLLDKNNTSKVSNVKILWDGDASKVVGEFTVDYTNAIVNPQYEGAMSLETPFSYDGGSGVYYVYHTGTVEEEENGVKVTRPAKIAYDYVAGANLVKVKFTGAETPTKVSIGDKEIKAAAGVYSIPVKAAGESTIIDVQWDAQNVQQFTVRLHETKGRLETPASGTIAVDTTEGKDKVVNYNGNVNHAKFADAEAVTTKDDATNKVTAGYVLPIDITAPEAANITTGTAKVVVSGGRYSADDKANNYGAKDVTITNGAITVTPVIISKNDKLTITVDWNGGFKETYTVNLNNATLVNGEGSLKAAATEDANRSLSDFDGQIAFEDDANKYTLELAITGNVDGVDAVKVFDVITPEDKQETGRVATVTGGKFKVSFDNEHRTATVKVRWENGYIGTYTINASKATIPTIILDSNIKKNEAGEYVINAKVGDNIGKIISSVLPNGAVAEATATGKNADGKDVLNKLANGTFEAAFVGTSTISCTMTGAESFTINVIVTNNAVNATSTVSKEGEGLRVVTTPTGGTNSGYVIKIAYFEYVESGANAGRYVEKTIDSVTVKNGADYVTTINGHDGEKLADKYKLIITTRDSKTAEGAATGALANQETVEVLECPTNVRYTVTFDTDGGEVFAPVTLEAADGVNNSGKIDDYNTKYAKPKKADGLSTNKLYTIKYDFTKWVAVVDGKLDEKDNLNKDTVITSSKTYKAIYEETYVDAEGNEFVLNDAGELVEK